MASTTTNIGEFSLQLDKFAEKLEIEFRLVMKKVAVEVFTSIVMKTPVDTGLARASWVIGVNGEGPPPRLSIKTANRVVGTARRQKRQGVADEKISRDAATAIAMARLTGFRVKKGDQTVVISNHLPYIQFLEKGSSKQAPAGMVRLTLEEVAARLAAGFR